MAIFQLEIVDEDVQRVFDAVCGSYGWLAELPNPDYVEGGEAPKTIPNPETQGDFTHRKVREYLSEIVAAYEIKLAKQTAQQSLNTSVGISDPEA